ncbi:MAG: NAD-dependent succinate-semialdehyde dehydrogenase [Deltaproteobacteria bacterium]|nr:NAD-dependent succinate-semialdehyde dehydrogenase [Deltaproteobacteria bacterium]
MFTPHSLGAAFINGTWESFPDLPRLSVDNPFNSSVLGAVPNCDSKITERAIEVSANAFRSWQATTVLERSTLLKRAASLLREHEAALASLLTLEQGKPISQAKGEIQYGASYFEWFAEETRRTYGDVIPSPSPGRRIMVLKEPIGVCAAITPWNFPHAMIARKAAAALAAGCTIIVKPASETPFSALAIAKVCELAGLPPGVINIVTGDPEPIAKALMASSTVRKLTFTGSTGVGKLLMRQSADTLKRLTLELGGNAPFIVFADADLDLAAKDFLHAKYRNAGQTCICANRVLLHSAIADQFIDKIASLSEQLKVGDGSLSGTDIGPLISSDAKEKVWGLLNDAISKGARIRSGKLENSSDLLMKPVIIDKVTKEMRLWEEEIFGPVAACAEFQSDEEAIKLANDSQHGLAAYLFTRDLSLAHRAAERLEYGMVGINSSSISLAEAPFGGVKQSGFGREGSRYGIEEYLSIKYVSINLN